MRVACFARPNFLEDYQKTKATTVTSSALFTIVTERDVVSATRVVREAWR